MHFIPENALAYVQMMYGMGIPVGSGISTAEYDEWSHTQKQYATTTGAAGLTSTNFYLVLAFPQGDFADRIDMHPSLPMMVPTSGTSPPILGVFTDEKAATAAMDKDAKHVHLMYKLRLRGYKGIRDFLEFMADHDMMESLGGSR